MLLYYYKTNNAKKHLNFFYMVGISKKEKAIRPSLIDYYLFFISCLFSYMSLSALLKTSSTHSSVPLLNME